MGAIKTLKKGLHLHVIVAIEGLTADWTGKLGRSDEDLSRRGDPVLSLSIVAAAAAAANSGCTALVWGAYTEGDRCIVYGMLIVAF